MRSKNNQPGWSGIITLCLGVGILAAAAAMAPYTKVVLTSARDGHALWLGVNLGLLGCGALFTIGHRWAWVTTLAIMTLNVILVGALFGELAIRAGMHFDQADLRNPELYSGNYDDELYWRLKHRWTKKPTRANAKFVFDPRLGWATPESRRLAEDIDDRPPGALLVYGDSFTQGVPPTRVKERIPAILAAELDLPVHNRAVSGYGIDQIYLQMLDTSIEYERPTIVFGLLTVDLDRAMLKMFSRPKPKFEIDEDGKLKLTNIPLPEDSARWLADNPLKPTSYLAALLWNTLWIQTDSLPSERIYNMEETKRLATALLEATATRAIEQDAQLLLVLFYGEWELHYEGWREQFLKKELQRLGVPLLDTKPLYMEYAENHNIPMSDIYAPPPNHHPTHLGNTIAAQAIAQRLGELYGAPLVKAQ